MTARTVDEYLAMPLDELAALAAHMDAELALALNSKYRLESALHLRRLEVAHLRTELGRTIDGDCAHALRVEAERRARDIRTGVANVIRDDARRRREGRP